MKSALLLALLALGAAADETPKPASSIPPAELMPPNVRFVETVLQRRPLHALNTLGGLRLPKIEVFEQGSGHLLHVVGWDKRTLPRLNRALQNKRISLGDPPLQEILATLDDKDGNAITPLPLADGDVVVVVYWAAWCGPCGTAMTELRKHMQADPSRRYVWYAIESDPVKQKLQRQTIR